MDRVHVIRDKFYREGISIRRIARELSVSRNTVRKYLQQSEPVRQESGPRARPVLNATVGRIESLLDEWGPRTTAKQRLTGTRIHRELVEEGYAIGVTTVREYLAEKKRQGRDADVPLLWLPGDAAEVDFFEVTVEINGEMQKAWKFLMHLMYSGWDFVWLYERCNQIAFLDGHVRAFQYFGAVPHRNIYDRLTAAVKRKLHLSELQLTERFLALVNHYNNFEPCFARPGEGHDKGGVEARGKAVRLAHLTPIPRGRSLDEIAHAVLAEVEKGASGKQQRFAEEKPRLKPLPERPFEARLAEPVLISRQALVRVDGAEYSVPSHWKSLQAMAHIGVADIRLDCRSESVTLAKVARGKRVVRYRHYLPELAKKPQALRQVAPRLLEELGEPYATLWRLLVGRYGELDAARALAKILGAVVDHGEQTVGHALQAILEHSAQPEVAPVAAQPLRVPEALSAYTVESASAKGYDALLAGEANHE